jgi:hypothetical protein
MQKGQKRYRSESESKEQQEEGRSNKSNNKIQHNN